MATKRLKDKIINVRATDVSKAILDSLSKELNISQADVVELALKELCKSIKK